MSFDKQTRIPLYISMHVCLLAGALVWIFRLCLRVCVWLSILCPKLQQIRAYYLPTSSAVFILSIFFFLCNSGRQNRCLALRQDCREWLQHTSTNTPKHTHVLIQQKEIPSTCLIVMQLTSAHSYRTAAKITFILCKNTYLCVFVYANVFT